MIIEFGNTEILGGFDKSCFGELMDIEARLEWTEK